MNEKWTQKYKRSIDCSNPKGFSQKAHCQGRKKNEMTIEEKLNLFLEKNCPTSPDKWAASKAAARSKFDVYPSAYANGWAAKNYKSKGGGWRTCKESVNEANMVGKTIFSNGKGKLFFGYYKDDDSAHFVDYKTWKNLSMKDVSTGETNKDRIINAIIRDQKQFNKKVDYNMWVKKTNPSFEEKMDWFIKNGWISNITKNGIKESIESNQICEDCWDGYKSVGGKMKDGKMVPNCVPVKENNMKLKKEMNHDVTDHPERRDKDGEINYGRVEPLEYDVDNYDDHVDFIAFMKEYTKQLNEAGCGCVYEAEYQGRSVKLGKPMQGDVKKFKVYVRNGQGNVVKVNFGDPNMRIKKSNPERRKSFRARHNCDNPGPRWKARYWSCRKW